MFSKSGRLPSLIFVSYLLIFTSGMRMDGLRQSPVFIRDCNHPQILDHVTVNSHTYCDHVCHSGNYTPGVDGNTGRCDLKTGRCICEQCRNPWEVPYICEQGLDYDMQDPDQTAALNCTKFCSEMCPTGEGYICIENEHFPIPFFAKICVCNCVKSGNGCDGTPTTTTTTSTTTTTPTTTTTTRRSTTTTTTPTTTPTTTTTRPTTTPRPPTTTTTSRPVLAFVTVWSVLMKEMTTIVRKFFLKLESLKLIFSNWSVLELVWIVPFQLLFQRGYEYEIL